MASEEVNKDKAMQKREGTMGETQVESGGGGRGRKGLCTSLCSMLKLTKEGATPVNWKVVFVVIFTLFGSCYSITFLFPFLPEMVLWFGYKEEDKGYYAGIVASAMFAGRAVGSYFWGWLSDKIGRRPVVIISLIGIAASDVAFGFSTGIIFAFTMRFCTGLFNGLVGVCKTVLYETSDNTNQAVGMSCIGFAWGSGVIMGPLISGYIANPAVRYPTVFSADGFFGQFPFFLPSFLAGVIAIIVLVVDIFMFPETLESKVKKVDLSEEAKCDENEDKTLAIKTEKSAASPHSKHSHLLRPSSVDVCASMASLDIQLASPMCHLSRPSINANPFLQRAFSDSGERSRKALYRAQSIHMMVSVDEKGEDLENYPLKKRRTSLSMQHIPSSSLLKELAEKDTFDEDIEEEGKIYSEKSNENLTEPNKQDSQGEAKPTNPESYVKDTDANESQNCSSETTAMLETRTDVSNDIIKGGRPVVPNDTHAVSPQISIVISDEPTESELGKKVNGEIKEAFKDDVKVEKANKNSGCLKKMKNLAIIKLFRIVDVRYSVMLYSVFSFSVIGLEEVFTVWASTEIELGGLAFGSEKIGAVIGFPSIPLMFLQIIIYPKVSGAIGNIRTFQLFNTYLILATPLIPTLRALHDKHTALWIILMVMQGIQKISFTSCFTSSSLLINNSIEPALAGTVNGLAMTLTAVARTLGPTVGGSLYAWSLSHGRHIGFPFDVNLIFIIFAIVFLASNILSVFMPKTLEKQKKPQAS